MYNTISKVQSVAVVMAIVLLGLVGVLPIIAHAQVDDSGCCDDSYDSSYTPSYDSSYAPSYDSSSAYDSTYVPDYDSTYAPSYDSTDVSDYDSTSLPDYDSTSIPGIDEDGVTYSEETYPTTYSEEAYSTPAYGYSTPLSISAPFSYGIGSYGYSTPIIASAPIAQNVPSSYQTSQPSVTNNTCVNYSCNTVTTVSNSGNTTTSNPGNTITTIVPVATAPVTYPVQYTFPQPVYTYYPNYNYENVSCTITAEPDSIQAGQYTYLTWQSYDADTATLTNYGNVAPDGSLSVQPYGSTEYVLTVYGYDGQTATCSAYVNVGSNYPSVTLSQIPYTGFDLGTFGDAMYFALLAAFALAAGYLLVYYRGGMGAFALAMVPNRKTSVSTVKFEKAAPVVEKKTVVASAPAKASSIDSLPTFSNVRPTSDSMTVANDGGAPRIVINRS